AKANGLAVRLKELAGVLGLLEQEPESFLQGNTNSDEAAEIEALIKQRNEAKANKNWAVADEVRDKLKAMNIVLEDTPNGTIWRKA
ncbi:DALR domain-containing protein, partial [Actinobacillus minor]|uniref:CysS/YqeB C-terminal domain-containing protein n=1 Tax=Actinobacillus minor TaxID=51047 RepID=UPI0034E98773